MSESLYVERAWCVIAFARAAQAGGCLVGFQLDVSLAEPHLWPVLFVDLPTGQVSWHLSPRDRQDASDIGEYPGAWDGHTTEEKYRRLNAWRPNEP